MKEKKINLDSGIESEQFERIRLQHKLQESKVLIGDNQKKSQNEKEKEIKEKIMQAEVELQAIQSDIQRVKQF